MNIDEIKAELKTEKYDFLKTHKSLGDNVILFGSKRFFMKKKITFAAFIWTALFALSGCVDNPENISESVVSAALPNTKNIFCLESRSDMTVTLYYDVEEPTIAFILPDGTMIDAEKLPTERGDGAVCYHIADAAPGQWKIAYDKKSNIECSVNWAPDISPIF